MRTYSPALTLRLLVGIFLIVPGGVLLGFAASGSNPAVTGGIGAPLFAAGALLWWLAGRARLEIDDRVVRRRGHLGGVIELRFDEITEYRYSSSTVNGMDTVSTSVQSADGRKISVTSNWRDPFEATRQLIEGAEAYGLKDQLSRLGQPRMEFGPVAIEDAAFVAKGKRIPFAEITSIELAGPSLRVKKTGKLLPALWIGSSKVPNVFLLLDELRARGVSAPDARPWRAAVSVAGFQLPKK